MSFVVVVVFVADWCSFHYYRACCRTLLIINCMSVIAVVVGVVFVVVVIAVALLHKINSVYRTMLLAEGLFGLFELTGLSENGEILSLSVLRMSGQ